MKKYATGFVPVTYWKVGIVLLAVGAAGLLIGLVVSLADWLAVPRYVFFAGGASVLVGLYLVFVVPRE